MRFKFFVTAVTLIFASLVAANAFAYTIASAASGSWQTPATWGLVTGTGTVTTTLVSTQVNRATGATLFATNQFAAGDQVYTAGGVLIGTVTSVASENRLILVANAAVAVTNAVYQIKKIPKATDDVTITAGHTVTMTAAVAANSLTVNGTLTQNQTMTITNGLTVAGTLTSSGVLTINGATPISITGTGSLTSTNTIAATAGPTTIANGGALNITNITGTHDFGAVTNAGTWNVGVAETVTFTGNLTNSGTFTAAATSTHSFTGGAAQIITPTSAIQFGNLTIAKAAANTVTLANNVSVAGNLSVTSGTLDLATFTADRTAVGGTITVSNGATLLIGGTSTFPANYTNNTLGATSTVNYNGTTQAVRGGITYGNLTVSGGGTKTLGANAPVAGNLTVSAGMFDLDTFTANRTAGGGAISISNGATLKIGGTNSFPTNYTTRTLGATSTVEYDGTNQMVLLLAAPGYGHLILSGSGTKTFSAATAMAIRGNFTMAGTAATTAIQALTIGGDANLGTGTVFTAGAFIHNVAGNFTNNATTFTVTGSTFNFNGGGPQSITGATTFNNVTLNNGSSLTINNDVTVNTTLTLTTGWVTTGTNILTIASGNAIGSAGANNFVEGNLRKPFAAGARTRTFEVGTTAGANKYAPVTITFAAVTTPGNITVSSTAGDHPQIATSGINTAKHVNRYWTITNSGVAFSTYDATFTFVTGAPTAGDVDAAANPLLFVASQYTGAGWNEATVSGNSATTLSITAETGFGVHAVGEQAGVSSAFGRFNAYDLKATPTISGSIRTKLVGTSFDLTVVGLNAGALQTNFGIATVEVLDASSPTGVPDANQCRPGWTSLSPAVTQTINFGLAGTQSQTVTLTVNKAYRDLRVRISHNTFARIGCSADNFSVRPAAFTITSTNATQTDSSGTPTIKTGASFNLTATAVAGYSLAPSIDNVKVTAPFGLTAGAIGGVFSAASAATGIATGASFFYNEVGNFGLAQNAVYDSSFTSVDQPTGCTADFSNTAVNNLYGCSFGSTPVPLSVAPSGTGFGRFIPDNFNVTLNAPTNAPTFGTTCGTFSYIGQRFNYTILPVMTVTARNGTANGLTNATTRNYAGPYMKITNATLTPNTTAGRYSRFDALAPPVNNTPALDTSNMPAAGSDPVIAAALTATSVIIPGVYTLTFSSNNGSASPGLAFTRSATASNLFNADIALAVNVIDGDSVAYASNPASFGAATAGNGMAFSSGKEMRYGRLRIANTYGSELLPLPVNITTQYWNGTQYLTNTADNCTSFAAANFAQAPPPTGPTITTTIQGSGTLSNGAGRITLTKPTGPVGPSGVIPKGSVDVSSTIPYLSPGLTGRETFGVYKSGPVIYMREIY